MKYASVFCDEMFKGERAEMFVQNVITQRKPYEQITLKCLEEMGEVAEAYLNCIGGIGNTYKVKDISCNQLIENVIEEFIDYMCCYISVVVDRLYFIHAIDKDNIVRLMNKTDLQNLYKQFENMKDKKEIRVDTMNTAVGIYLSQDFLKNHFEDISNLENNIKKYGTEYILDIAIFNKLAEFTNILIRVVPEYVTIDEALIEEFYKTLDRKLVKWKNAVERDRKEK